MLTPFYKKDNKLVSFLNLSKRLKEIINNNKLVNKSDIIILRVKSITSDLYFEYYLDKETAKKYNISNNDIILEEELLTNDFYADFDDEIDIIESKKILEIITK